MRTNTLLTIYNKYVDPTTRTEVYQRSSLGQVMWENRKGSNVIASGGKISADQARIFIPFSIGADYVGPKAWQALSDKTENWTIQIGDIVVKGEVLDEIETGFAISNLKAKYDDVLVVSSVDVMDFGSVDLQHWQVGAV